MKSFGTMLREARETSRYSTRSQADKAHVSHATYRGWEEDEGLPTRFQLKRMFGGGHPIMHYLPGAAPSPPPSAPEVGHAGVPARPVSAVQEAEVDLPPPPSRSPQLPPAQDDVRRAMVAACDTLGAAIFDCRVAADLRQRELGELLGVWQGTVSQWELNNALPIADHYDRLCDLFPELHAYQLSEADNMRDMVKPVGGYAGGGGRPLGALDAEPRRDPVRPTLSVASVLLGDPPSPSPPPAQDAPRAPDGLEMLASAIALANLLWPEDTPHRALVELLPAGGGWQLTVEGGDSPTVVGEGRTERLALGRLRMALRDQIDARAADLDRELEEQRRAIEARRAHLAELRALVGEDK